MTRFVSYAFWTAVLFGATYGFIYWAAGQVNVS
jgi:hypothetical protein